MVTLDELKDKLADKARLIGLDLGSKRIGVAICDDERKIATPFKTIEYRNMDYLLSELKVIIKENDIFAIIVGNPINMDGSFGKSAQSINDKAKIIGRELHATVLPARDSHKRSQRHYHAALSRNHAPGEN